MAQTVVNKTLAQGIPGEFVDASPRRTFKGAVYNDDGTYGAFFYAGIDGKYRVCQAGEEYNRIAVVVNPKEDVSKTLRGIDEEGQMAVVAEAGSHALCTLGRVWMLAQGVRTGTTSDIEPITDIAEARTAASNGTLIIGDGGGIMFSDSEVPEGGAILVGVRIVGLYGHEPEAGLYLVEAEIADPKSVVVAGA